jgi:hypothetical protein
MADVNIDVEIHDMHAGLLHPVLEALAPWPVAQARVTHLRDV